ncbi:MAG: hypothetical protein PHQ25_06345 [Acidobacteriota bacterium]|nr:hypothetical protein [Acidobacteriota bacterium]MDW3228973.1 hypothetical protein [Acidobacteriota bacterium]MDY0231188.1 hypothetical protein [Candidatus Saccharicenans sp.]
MDKEKRFVLGMVIIAVINLFVALMTIAFWTGHLLGNRFAKTLPVPDNLYQAFALPDLVMSAFLIISFFGLLKFKKLGYICALIGVGMWLFDVLLVTGLTGFFQIGVVIPSLIFCLWAIFYLWKKREIFQLFSN